MFTCVKTLLAKTDPVKPFFETVIKPWKQGWNCRTAGNRRITALIMAGHAPVEYLVWKAHGEPHGVSLLHKYGKNCTVANVQQAVAAGGGMHTLQLI